MLANILNTVALVLACCALWRQYSAEYWNNHQRLMQTFVPWQGAAPSRRILRQTYGVSWPVVTYFVFKHCHNKNLKWHTYTYEDRTHHRRLVPTEKGKQEFAKLARAA